MITSDIARFSRSMKGRALAAALAMILGSCAANATDLAPDDEARVAHICSSVMGLSPGEAHYVGCIQSLAATVTAMHDAARTHAQHEACMAKGLKPGTRDFAVCALEVTP